MRPRSDGIWSRTSIIIMKVVAIFRLGRILQQAGLCRLQKWERLLRFPKQAAFIIGTSAALLLRRLYSCPLISMLDIFFKRVLNGEY
jgi:hypothetical protein